MRAYLPLCAAWLISCSVPFSSERVVPERASLGAEMYRVICQRLAGSEVPSDVDGDETQALCEGLASADTAPTARLRELSLQRDRIVGALDEAFPPDSHDALDRLLLDMLPLYEPPSETLPRQMRAVGNLLGELAADEEALIALERIAQRRGYRAPERSLGPAAPLLGYPRLAQVNREFLGTIGEDGIAEGEFEELVRALSVELATAEPSGPSDALQTVRELLSREREDFGSDLTGEAPIWAIERDSRGIVLPRGGTVLPPFIDQNNDGLADIDDIGRFVDGTGEPLTLPTPFPIAGEESGSRDREGRALRSDGTFAFEYTDLNNTLLAALVREAPAMIEPNEGSALDLAYGIHSLMGPEEIRRQPQSSGITAVYRGYDTSESPLLDLVDAAGVVIARPETDPVLGLTQIVLESNENEIARVIDGALRTDEFADITPAGLRPGSEFWDDVLQQFTLVAQEPELMEALLRALADERGQYLGAALAEMMRYRDSPTFDPSNPNVSFADQDWNQEVDYNAPNTRENSSIFQRTLSMIHDLSGVRLCNKEGAVLLLQYGGETIRYPFSGTARACDLIEIEDVAEAYALSIIGRYELELKDDVLNHLISVGERLGVDADEIMQASSGIDGLTRNPTPEAMNRLVFAMEGNEFLESVFDPPLTRDGEVLTERHDPIVFAWEREFRFCRNGELISHSTPCSGFDRTTFYEAITPLLEAFDDFDRRNDGRFLFADIISAMHLHWPSDTTDHTQEENESASFFARHDNVRSYEPIVADLFATCRHDGGECTQPAGDVIRSLQSLLAEVDDIGVGSEDGLDLLASAGLGLIDPNENPGLQNRRGESRALTAAETRTVPLTPLYMLVDALVEIDEAFEVDPDRLKSWRGARSRLIDHFFSVQSSGGRLQLINRRARGILIETLPFLREQLQEHREIGDTVAWSRSFDEELQENLDTPLAAAALRTLDAVQTEPEARDEIARAVAYTLDEATEGEAFEASVVAIHELLGSAADDQTHAPIAHLLAEAISPGVAERVAAGGTLDLATLELENSVLDTSIEVLAALEAEDDSEVLPDAMRNLVRYNSETRETPLEVLIDVVCELNRLEPNSGERLTREDMQAIATAMEELILDEDRGLERIFAILRSRRLASTDAADTSEEASP